MNGKGAEGVILRINIGGQVGLLKRDAGKVVFDAGGRGKNLLGALSSTPKGRPAKGANTVKRLLSARPREIHTTSNG